MIALLAVSIICIFFVMQIRNNRNKLKWKIESGKIIDAQVISWKVITGRPTFYVMKVAYEIDHTKKNKTFITSGKFAKKYELDRNIQIVMIPNSNKVYFYCSCWQLGCGEFFHSSHRQKYLHFSLIFLLIWLLFSPYLRIDFGSASPILEKFS